ncbi:MAG: hypothetical protein AABO58_08605 [Acidobacteriota bacterium]
MPESVNPETHHEKSDVNVRALLWAVVIFIIFGGVTHLLLYMQFNFFRQMFRGATNAPLTSIARPPDAAVPQEPRLQPFQNGNPPNSNTPVTDMEQMRAAEERALHTAGWVDRGKGIVRLPIETAKALAVQRLAQQPTVGVKP